MAKQLTLGETDAVERLSGLPIEALKDPGAPKGRLVMALVTVIKKRSDPNFTMEQAGDMPADEAGQIVGEFFGEPDPLS